MDLRQLKVSRNSGRERENLSTCSSGLVDKFKLVLIIRMSSSGATGAGSGAGA